MTAVFLQARLDSTRLPGKALLDLSGMTVIEHAMRSLGSIPAEHHVLVTDRESAPVFRPYTDKWNFSLFQGPKEDVLKRFVLALEMYRADHVVRATGDNPLVSGPMAAELLKLHASSGADRSGFVGPPVGTGVEIVSSESLRAADTEAEESYEREHVTPFIYRRPGRFRIVSPEAPEEWTFPEGWVTLDTPEDYRFLGMLFQELYAGDSVPLEVLVRELKIRKGNAER